MEEEKVIELNIDIDEGIFDVFGREAKKRGLSAEEYIKYVIGTHAMMIEEDQKSRQFMSFPNMPSIPQLPSDMVDSLSKATSMLGPMMDNILESGILKCKNCTMKLDIKALETGICSCCGASLKN